MSDIKYVIGVDGGGTKTTVALADESGEILSVEKGGPSNIRNVGLEVAVENIFDVIKKVKKEESISCYCLTLASVVEEQQDKKEEVVRMLKEKGLEGEIFIESDQLSAFRAGTDEKDGVVVIAGTGAVAKGWNKGREFKTNGWGYFSDEGSAFYAGIEAYRAVQKSFDGRGEKTIMEDLAKEKLNIHNIEDLNSKIYLNYFEFLPKLSVIVDEAEQKRDVVARNILEKVSEELFSSAKTVIEKLELDKSEFPVILSGGMFRSKSLVDDLSEKISSAFSNAKISVLQEDPVKGAVKIAINI